MNKYNFKVGDWCFSNFELCQIKEMKNEQITSVTTGTIERSGYSLNYSCFPLELRIKRISDVVEYWSKKLHSLNAPGLNYPDIIRSLESRWVEMCESKNDATLQELYKELESFCKAIIERVNSFRYEKIEGVNIFRQ